MLEQRTAHLTAKEDKVPPPRSYFPVRVKSEKSRADAATSKRDPER
ncbi:hypothetical protein HNQ68_002121 [Pseudochrobactrum saccharolyticum]|uniref:Uncharacterized protein n=1 Tax=Pseudochrobactrum saccharolyticum TaxID=354352 RepID=A0A7W8AJV2_9HYPH|nr:hypothetical protein [Pseudochrobactrum saccharolyticum]MBB5091580.1 hypothetical protein [Pseudochrobactrum saccharolyticum]